MSPGHQRKKLFVIIAIFCGFHHLVLINCEIGKECSHSGKCSVFGWQQILEFQYDKCAQMSFR